jgi:hypothetical protein
MNKTLSPGIVGWRAHSPELSKIGERSGNTSEAFTIVNILQSTKVAKYQQITTKVT